MARSALMNSKKFKRVALAAWIMQALIVLSGAAVRLTQAGLGCADWPTCNDDELLPEWELHGLVEFGNRVISIFVTVSAVLAVVAAYRRRPRRPQLIRLAWGLVAGTLVQVVLGGITVLVDLHPIVVSVHFLVSMILLWNAQTLWVRAGEPEVLTTFGGGWPARLQLAMATTVLLTGTIVTGSGPNSGDSRADRLGFELESAARLHSVCAWLLIATVLTMTIRIVRADGQGSRSFTAAQRLVVAIAAQGALGYTQFAIGVPPVLVELHILGAITVWSLAIAFFMALDDEAVAGGSAARPTTAHKAAATGHS